MIAGRGEGTRGRGHGGRAETQRQSRRVQGLAPPEQESLEVVERATRTANAAKCKDALESKQASDAEVRTDVQEDAHQVLTDKVLEEASEVVVGESGLDEPGQAGMCRYEVSRVVGRVSDSSQPGQDVSPEAQPNIQMKLLSPVPKEKRVEEEVGPTLEEKPQSKLKPSTELVQVEPRADTTNCQLAEQVAKAYTASQVSRWEQDRSEEDFPLRVKYSWSRGHSDSVDWMNVALSTSKYLTSSFYGRPCPIIHELAPGRHDLATAQGLIEVQVSTGLITPMECVAILQTMIYEAGFRLQILVLVWLQAHAAKVAPGAIRHLVTNVQHLIAAELIAWRLIMELRSRSDRHWKTKQGTRRRKWWTTTSEDKDGDLIISDVNLFRRTYVLRLRMAGLRPIRSPTGSSFGKPLSKRPQHRPPRPENLLGFFAISTIIGDNGRPR
ncbi:LOW QUALITY PROTEIN: hypothetical protein PHMEG_0005563 [Phytophthora megakarya]|uniref:Uncharacterized protein n=1 Tax=Phytophthora megakarya TaxID=4795 RepID=A0A225WT03_9STRA|nr:LOW QUALITY PROTEIN: hypothetical protein PHMEG_0005563 [Phytophthora megakarya]